VLLIGNASLGYSLQHLDLSGLTAMFNRLLPIAKTQAAKVAVCEPRWQPAGMDANERERMMLYMEAIVDEYQSTFGRLPEQINDLDKVPSFQNADRLNGLAFKKNCNMLVRAGSYALGCGSSRPSTKELYAFLSESGHTPGFYNLRTNEILYIPKADCS
jgi:hypothetical protein